MPIRIRFRLISRNANFDTGAGEVPIYSWVDLTSYVREPITFNDSIGGQLANGAFTLEVPENFTPVSNPNNLDWSKPLPPRIYLDISYIDALGGITYQKAFITSDTSVVPLRFNATTWNESTNEVRTETAIYQHQVNFVSIIKTLEGITLPNLTITQPKNTFSRQLVRQAGWVTFSNQQLITPLENQTIPDNEVSLVGLNGLHTNSFIPSQNATGFISSIGNTAAIRINDISTLGYVISVQPEVFITAPNMFVQEGGLWGNGQGVRVTTLQNLTRTSYFGFTGAESPPETRWRINGTVFDTVSVGKSVRIDYYNSSNTIISTITTPTRFTQTRGLQTPPLANLPTANPTRPFNLPFSASPVLTPTESYSIPQNAAAAYVIITPIVTLPLQWAKRSVNTGPFNVRNIPNDGEVGQTIEVTPSTTNTDPTALPGPTSRYDQLQIIVNSIRTTVTSGTITETDLVGYQTCLDVVNKALREVANRVWVFNEFIGSARNIYRLDEKTALILQQFVAPELSFNTYNLREFLRKIFTICNIELSMGTYSLIDTGYIDLTLISHTTVGTDILPIDLFTGEHIGRDQQLTLDEYNDVLESRLTNLIDLNNTITDVVGLGTTGLEMSQITQTNASFNVQYPIYWLRTAKLSRFEMAFTSVVDGVTINQSIAGTDPAFGPLDARQTWDISTRIFERDIYNALPDVNYNSPGARANGVASKGNSIFYTSGSTTIAGLGHTGPNIPTYNIFTAGVNTMPDMAVIEMLAVLAWQRILAIGTFVGPSLPPIQDPPVTFANMAFLTLTIDYVPMHEYEYRNVSTEQTKLGLNSSRRVNAQDQTLAWEDVTTYITNEHNQTGKIVNTIVYRHNSLAEVFPIGSYVGGGHVITSSNMTIYNDYLEVSYTITKNYRLQNDNLRLAIAYERFAVPFNYVSREVLHHIYLAVTLGPSPGTNVTSSVLLNRYQDITVTPNITLQPGQISSLLVAASLGFRSIPDNLIARATTSYEDTFNGQQLQTNRELMVKVHTLSYKNSISRIGRMLDNYTAGLQRFINGTTANIPPVLRSQVFSQPFRYTDTLGRVSSLEYQLFTTLEDEQNVIVDAQFPDATGILFSGGLYRSRVSSRETGLQKDAREAYEFNLTTSAVPVHKDILICDLTKRINRLSFIENTFDYLNSDSSITDIHPIETHTIPISGASQIGLSQLSGHLVVTISIPTPVNNPLQGSTLALWYDGTTDNEPNTLAFVIRNYGWSNAGGSMQFTLHVAPTRLTLFPKQ